MISNVAPAPPPLSDPARYSRRTMKTLVNGLNEPRYWNLVARFGRARLLSRADGRVELHGGTDSDRTEAKEWISLFLHDAILRLRSGN